MRTRAALARRWVAEGAARPAEIARALVVSRQCLYLVPSRPPRSERADPLPPVLPPDWQSLDLATACLKDEEVLHVLARRHPRAGYRKLAARLRRAGYGTNRKRVARLLRAWGFTRPRRAPHPKAQGRPFDISAPNQLWQTDLTSIWCGEGGWGYFCAVIDCYDRSILGWSFSTRCRAKDIIPALEEAWATTWPHGLTDEEKVAVVLRHDNGTQFGSTRYREVARDLRIKLSRTAYRHPDGNAFVERLYRSLKEECVWINEFNDYAEALAAITAWVDDYNLERPHQSLGDRTPAEVRSEAFGRSPRPHNRAA